MVKAMERVRLMAVYIILPAREHQHQLCAGFAQLDFASPRAYLALTSSTKPQLALVLAATGKIATRQQGFARGCKTAFGHVGFRHITRKPLEKPRNV